PALIYLVFVSPLIHMLNLFFVYLALLLVSSLSIILISYQITFSPFHSLLADYEIRSILNSQTLDHQALNIVNTSNLSVLPLHWLRLDPIILLQIEVLSPTLIEMVMMLVGLFVEIFLRNPDL